MALGSTRDSFGGESMIFTLQWRLLCAARAREARIFSGVLVLMCRWLAWPAVVAAGQGVTTASIAGVVKDSQGAVTPGATIVAVHEPSGTTYETVSQADGRYLMQGLRVGGPYTVTASLGGFSPDVRNNITLTLGVTQDIDFSLKPAGIAETVTVVGTSDPVFSTTRSGAATSVMRDDLASLPTISGTHHRYRQADAAIRCRWFGRRPGQPREQHHHRWLLLQRHIRSGHGDRRARRPCWRCADLARSDRAGPGERGAVRRPSG